ncbi:uncharacterized protein RAG0_08708 [Rhynchosporium agropyri]|uniref:Uncharacterized protein n=1 Tax=Rhynchosporium agropyri TaxID=914238 RepID=A0A1E1KS77_9HELO|nr:uncharacterized protein RAG0_08708 [Rhynchosporium agropyri]
MIRYIWSRHGLGQCNDHLRYFSEAPARHSFRIHFYSDSSLLLLLKRTFIILRRKLVINSNTELSSSIISAIAEVSEYTLRSIAKVTTTINIINATLLKEIRKNRKLIILRSFLLDRIVLIFLTKSKTLSKDFLLFGVSYRRFSLKSSSYKIALSIGTFISVKRSEFDSGFIISVLIILAIKNYSILDIEVISIASIDTPFKEVLLSINTLTRAILPLSYIFRNSTRTLSENKSSSYSLIVSIRLGSIKTLAREII